MADKPFDMQPASTSFEDRGGCVVNSLMTEFNLHREQAAGVVGNCGFESGGFKSLQEIGVSSYERGGYGWSQWTGPRRTAFEGWCRKQSLQPSSDEANYGYLCAEMRGAYAYCVTALRREITIERCVFVWGREYECPGGTTATFRPGNTERLAYAKRAFNGSLLQPSGAPAIPQAVTTVADPDVGTFLAAVRMMQTFLRDKKLYVGNIDGDFGPTSRAALA